MQTISISNVRSHSTTSVQTSVLSDKLSKLIELAESNRLGVVATFILIQVSIAGFNVVIPPMVGASTYLMAPGIILAFVSNGVALAQAQMKYVLAGFLLSMIVNAAVSIYCFIQLLNA